MVIELTTECTSPRAIGKKNSLQGAHFQRLLVKGLTSRFLLVSTFFEYRPMVDWLPS